MKMDAWKSISISIHTLHTEGDSNGYTRGAFEIQFQSTPSTRRVTFHFPQRYHDQRIFQSTPSTRRVTGLAAKNNFSDVISIHTLHTEGDAFTINVVPTQNHFNPHPPHGG